MAKVRLNAPTKRRKLLGDAAERLRPLWVARLFALLTEGHNVSRARRFHNPFQLREQARIAFSKDRDDLPYKTESYGQRVGIDDEKTSTHCAHAAVPQRREADC